MQKGWVKEGYIGSSREEGRKSRRDGGTYMYMYVEKGRMQFVNAGSLRIDMWIDR